MSINKESIEKELECLKISINKDPEMKETKISEWIRKNKALLMTSGGIATGAAKAIAWLVEHVDDIQTLVDTISKVFPAEAPVKTLDFDSLRIGNEYLFDALCGEPYLIAAVIEELVEKFGYETVFSKKHNLNKLGVYI